MSASAASRAGSSAWSGSSSWTWSERVAAPPAEPDEERDACRPPSRGRSSRCRGRRAARRLPGQPGRRARPVDRCHGPRRGSRRAGRRRPRSAHDPPPIAAASRRPGRRDRPAPRRPGSALLGTASRRRAKARQAALEQRRVVTGRRPPAPARPRRAAPLRRAELARAAAGRAPCASTSGSRRGPVQAGQPAVAAARGDQLRGPGDELVVALEQALGEPDPAGHRLVQVDRRRLVVRRADLGHEAEVARIDHQQDARDGLDRPPGARAARCRARRGASAAARPRPSASRPSSGARSRAGRSGPSPRSRR